MPGANVLVTTSFRNAHADDIALMSKLPVIQSALRIQWISQVIGVKCSALPTFSPVTISHLAFSVVNKRCKVQAGLLGGPRFTHLEEIVCALFACQKMVSLQLPVGGLQPCESLPCCCAKQWQCRQLIVRSLMADIDQGSWDSCIKPNGSSPLLKRSMAGAEGTFHLDGICARL